MSTSKGGNGQLKYPVALMTADEASFAGAASTWYYYNSESDSITGNVYWWTMSPYLNGGGGRMFYIGGSGSPGSLSYRIADVVNAVRPVISIKSCTTWKSGNGAWDTPYEASIDSNCALLEN